MPRNRRPDNDYPFPPEPPENCGIGGAMFYYVFMFICFVFAYLMMQEMRLRNPDLHYDLTLVALDDM
jgi:hypothetical protein